MADVDYRLQLMLEAQDNMSSKIVEVQKRVEDLKKQVNSTSESVKNAGSSASNILSGLKGTIAKLGLTAMAVKAGKSIIELADNLEKSKIAFETMLGSAEDAQIMLKQLSDFARKTPFELTGIRSSAQQLLAMGVQANDMIPTLKALGDVSAGLSVPLERLALNYGQVIAQGKLTGKELRDFTMAGVPLIDELSQMLGKSTTEIQNMISAGQITSDIMVQAFQNMTSEGGKFADLMNKQATTLSGLWSNFQDTLASIGEEIGMNLLPTLKGYVEQISSWIDEHKEQIIEVSQYIVETAKVVIDNVIGFVQDLGNAVSDFASFVNDIAGGIADAIAGGMTDADSTTAQGLTGMAGNWKDFFYYVQQGITAVVGSLRTALNVADSLVKTVGKKSFWSGLYESGNVKTNSREKGDNIFQTIGNWWNAEKKDFSDSYNGMKNYLGDAFKGVEDTRNKETNKLYNDLENNYLKQVEKLSGGVYTATKNAMSSSSLSLGGTGNSSGLGGSAGGSGSSKNSELEALKKEMQEYAKETERLKKQRQEYYKSLDNYAQDWLKKQKGVIDDVNKEYQEKFDDIQKKIEETEKTIESLNNAIESLKGQMASLQIDERKSIAKEVVNARKELQALEEQYEGLADVANSVSREDLQGVGGIGKYDVDLIKQYKDYQDELASMYSGMTEQEQAQLDKEIEYAERYDSLNGIEKIKEDYRIRQEEIQAELDSKVASLNQEQALLRQYKKEQQKLQDERIARIDEEVKKYQEMYDKVKAFEEKYMQQLETDHFKQVQMTERLIDQWNAVYRAKMRAMSAGSDGSRASGGPVYQGNQYLVGETGPELFIPSTNGRIVKNSDLENSSSGEVSINLNMGGVVINNGEDEEIFAKKIIAEIQRGLQLSKKGINIYNI